MGFSKLANSDVERSSYREIQEYRILLYQLSVELVDVSSRREPVRTGSFTFSSGLQINPVSQ